MRILGDSSTIAAVLSEEVASTQMDVTKGLLRFHRASVGSVVRLVTPQLVTNQLVAKLLLTSLHQLIPLGGSTSFVSGTG